MSILFARNVQKIKDGIQRPINTKKFANAIPLFKSFVKWRLPEVYSALVKGMTEGDLDSGVAVIPHTYTFSKPTQAQIDSFLDELIQPEWKELVDPNTLLHGHTSHSGNLFMLSLIIIIIKPPTQI